MHDQNLIKKIGDVSDDWDEKEMEIAFRKSR